jgi:diacylglycerol kinase (ATP)
MRALAITGPRTNRHQLRLFQQRFGTDLELCESPDATTLTPALHGCDVAVIFGGDGTLNRHLALIVEAKTPVLMVPTGSGNDFALATGIRSAADAFAVLEQVQQGQAIARSADLGHATLGDGSTHLFTCCLNVGLDADAARRTNLLPDWLKAAGGYFIGGLGAVLTYQPQPMKVTLGGGISEGEMWFASISNTPTFGGGLPIAPAAHIDDGLLECTIVRRSSRLQLLRHYPKILRGRHLGMDIVEQRQARDIEICSKIQLPAYADGEHLGNLPVKVHVLEKGLRVFGK